MSHVTGQYTGTGKMYSSTVIQTISFEDPSVTDQNN